MTVHCETLGPTFLTTPAYTSKILGELQKKILIDTPGTSIWGIGGLVEIPKPIHQVLALDSREGEGERRGEGCRVD